jgi:hypothetical protein
MTQWLVSFDTDRIKEYLFATPVLSDIREASALLDRLNNRRSQTGVKDIAATIQEVYPAFNREDPEQCVYAAGGSALVILPDEETAAQAIRAVERLYRQNTVAASITGTAIPISDEELRKRFGKKAQEAGHHLRKRKAERGRGRTLPVAPYMHFCDACAQLPAVHYDAEGGELICRACRIKRPGTGTARRGLWKRLTEVTKEPPPDAPKEWQNLLEETIGSATHEQHRPPDDFDAIGKSAKRKGYIALVYADGNRMGQVLEQLDTVDEYSRFARLVDDLLLRVTYQALMKQVQARPDKSLFEILMAGGDDLMLVTTPDVAFDLILDLSRDFEQYSKPLAPEGLSLGTGIVIAKARYPIAAMQQLATDLQKRAKRRSFEAGGGSAVDFAVVTAAGSEDLDRIRDRTLTEKGFVFPPGGETGYRLTQRPYTLDEMARLVKYVGEFKKKGMPHGQLQAMYDALFYSPIHASLAAIQTLGRAQTKHRNLLSAFFQDFGVQMATFAPPWRERQEYERGESKTVRDSALGDLVEIYPFL